VNTFSPGPTILTKRLVKIDGYGKQALRTGWVISEIHRRVLLESMAKQENPEDLHTARAVRSNFVQLLWFEALARYGDRQDEFEVLIDDKGRVIIDI
jgi:hypothetical protein